MQNNYSRIVEKRKNTIIAKQIAKQQSKIAYAEKQIANFNKKLDEIRKTHQDKFDEIKAENAKYGNNKISKTFFVEARLTREIEYKNDKKRRKYKMKDTLTVARSVKAKNAEQAKKIFIKELEADEQQFGAASSDSSGDVTVDPDFDAIDFIDVVDESTMAPKQAAIQWLRSSSIVPYNFVPEAKKIFKR